jgi:arylsulfatase A-like enzyme
LNEHATDGFQFTQAYANGYSTPMSFPAILTGTHADNHGGHKYMSDQRPFLAEKFQIAGYETAGFHTNPHLRDNMNYDSGFQIYNDFGDEAGSLSQLRYLITQNLDNNSALYRFLKRAYHYIRTMSETTDYTEAPKLNQKALRWIDDGYNEENPFFLWTHYMDVHYPFYPPQEFLDEVTDRSISRDRAISVNGKMHEDGEEFSKADVADLQALYRGEVRYMDHYLGEFIDEIKQRGLFENTIFVITSDHGELFGEHGLFGHPPSGYKESYHIPLILFGPGIPEAKTTDSTVTLLDLPPTIAELCNLETDPLWDGQSLDSFLDGSDTGDNKLCVLGTQSVATCLSEKWQLIWWRKHDHPQTPNREWELRDRIANKRVSPADHETEIQPLRDELKAFVESTSSSESLEEPAIDQTTEDRLEALGYR